MTATLSSTCRDFVAAVEAKLPWKQVGLPELFGSIKVKLTNPAESNSGYTFTGLLMNTMNGGEIPDAAAAMQLTPRVERLYRAMGRLEDSSGTLFKVYLSQGLGAHPMVVAYENQLIEFSQENPQLVDTVRSQIAVLYPRPTTWASHPMIALSEGGKAPPRGAHHRSRPEEDRLGETRLPRGAHVEQREPPAVPERNRYRSGDPVGPGDAHHGGHGAGAPDRDRALTPEGGAYPPSLLLGASHE